MTSPKSFRITAIQFLLLGLILLPFSLSARAQEQDWGKLTTDARAAHQKGDYTDAAALYKRALAIQVKTLGPTNLDVAVTLNNLAVLYQDENLYSQAEPLYKQALAIWEKAPGAVIQVASCMDNLADLYRDQHKDAEAEPLYNRALKVWEKAGQPEAPQAIATLSSLGEIYHVPGQGHRGRAALFPSSGGLEKGRTIR